MLLSIVMMVKNEEKYLENTLKSLQPLVNELKSEIIILDTGSTDKTIDIVREYTSNVYFEKWNDDFSSMRNKSIKYAKGKWILILDADEELVECNKLIEFFKTDLHKRYNCASIELKSIVSEDASIYNKTSILRLFKNSSEFKYVGAIHEQPMYKEPIFNDIAKFNHYGYMYENEEVKQFKLKRNEKILLSEYKKNPKDPYLNYQLAKNYTVGGDKEEALYYMEKAKKLYENINYSFIAVEAGLAKLHFEMGRYEKCEKICTKYIKKDNKNIDIYCYLALSQKALKKYDTSLENYNKYMWLVENYELSTQANDVCATGDTISFYENAKLDIIEIYYIQENYKLVLENVKNISHDMKKRIQFIILMSMYKEKKLCNITSYYNEFKDSLVEKNYFIFELEKFILNIKQSDRNDVYNILSKIDDNYGYLNKVRVGIKLNLELARKIILEEDGNYYGDIIYCLFKDGYNLVDIFEDIDNIKINNYLNYIIDFRKDIILDLYNYLIREKNSMNINKLKVYSNLAKNLLYKSKLKGDKLTNLYYMNIMYTYAYIKQIFRNDIDDKMIINLLSCNNQKFVIEYISIEKIKNEKPIDYIRKLKKLVSNNPQYKECIEGIIKKFETEIYCSEELKELKVKYKNLIEIDIKENYLNGAIEKINEYESIFREDPEILNFKAIINILKGNFEESEMILKNACMKNVSNYNILFNIAYVKEILGDDDESVEFLEYIKRFCCDEAVLNDIHNKLEK